MKPYIKGLYRKRDDILNKIRKYQEYICKHENVSKTPRSNTGNFDPNDDLWWYEYKCPDCNKFWTEKQ